MKQRATHFTEQVITTSHTLLSEHPSWGKQHCVTACVPVNTYTRSRVYNLRFCFNQILLWYHRYENRVVIPKLPVRACARVINQFPTQDSLKFVENKRIPVVRVNLRKERQR